MSKTQLSGKRPSNILARFFRRLVLSYVLPLAGFVVLLALVLLSIPVSIWQQSYVDDTRSADAALVLGAAVYTDTPSPVFLERIKHGINLYKQGHVKKLVFTGGQDRYDEVSEAGAARAVAMENGVPEEDILMEELSTKTWTNLKEAVPVVRDNNINSLLLVSDPIHMKRALVMAEDLGLSAYPSPTPTSRYKSNEEKLKFLKKETLYLSGYILRRALGYEGDWERREAELIQEIGKEILNPTAPEP